MGVLNNTMMMKMFIAAAGIAIAHAAAESLKFKQLTIDIAAAQNDAKDGVSVLKLTGFKEMWIVSQEKRLNLEWMNAKFTPVENTENVWDLNLKDGNDEERRIYLRKDVHPDYLYELCEENYYGTPKQFLWSQDGKTWKQNGFHENPTLAKECSIEVV